MRLVDWIVRHGHLSERALTDALVTGVRPEHLDQCDVCAERADRLGRWLDDVRKSADDATDAAFPTERLAAQHAQILRRLEQVDEPPRVIAFPQTGRPARREDDGRRRVAPAWVGIAAAAGLVIGVVGGHASAQLISPAAPVVATVPAVPAAEPVSMPSNLLEMDFSQYVPEGLGPINDLTFRPISTVAAN